MKYNIEGYNKKVMTTHDPQKQIIHETINKREMKDEGRKGGSWRVR